MLQYYKLEQRDTFDMKKTRTVYKLKSRGKFGGKDFVKQVAHRHGFSESVIEGVLSDVASELQLLLGQGSTVTVPGIGSFSLGIRLSEARKQQLEDELDAAEQQSSTDQQDAAEQQETASEAKVAEPNAANIELHHVNYRIDKELLRGVKAQFAKQKLSRIYGRTGSRITIDDMKQSDRIAAAHRFLGTNPFMHVSDYATITGLSYSSAQRELKELVKFQFSGITTRGRGSHKVYVLDTAS